MGDPDAPPLQAGEVLMLLERHGVRYVVVGGLAATVHGAMRVTFDIDLVPEWTDDNLDRLASALREAGAELQAPASSAPIPFPIDAHFLRQFEVSTWRTRFGDLDVIIGTPTRVRGVLARYEVLAADAVARDAFDVTILVANLDAIIESKQALGREADLVALPELHRLRERLR
ncbi:MAG: hypothetical protein ACRELC_07535 [Gemmatimonadota bacterium]